MIRYSIILGALLYATTALLVAALIPAPAMQELLGGVTLGFLVAVGFRLSPDQRRLTLLAVVGACGLELFASAFLGLYHYRAGQVPFFVIAGHALLFALALQFAESPLGRLCARAAPVLATVWCALGLSLFPLLGGRFDVEGAICLPVLLLLLWRTDHREFFGLVFFGASFLELVGTTLGVWAWAASTPFLQIPAGNPPSAIAGMYCLFYWTILRICALRIPHLSGSKRHLGPAPIGRSPRLNKW